MKKGFTLAEILITVSILGIIAVITVPNLIEKYQRLVTVVKVKKMYAQLINAYEQYLTENNGIIEQFPNTEEGAKKAYNEIIKPYFEIADEAGIDSTKKEKILGNSYKRLNGSAAPSFYDNKYYAFTLKNGSIIFITAYSTISTGIATIYYDINGVKSPNTWGKDLFSFSLDGNNVYAGSSINSKEYAINNCINQNPTGFGCTAWIIAKGNMNYLDCPGKADWDTGKCK